MSRYTTALAGLWLAVAALALWAYLPGLHGDFLFDDYGNLPALGAEGPVVSWGVFWRYITSGQADPTGRPLVLLSFLLDAHDWPAQAYAFKRTNLLLHLLNGLLLFILLLRLGRVGDSCKLPGARFRTDLGALLGAALWLLHPLFVSTTLYVVQREAMLPATFVLLGLLIWLHGRTQYAKGHSIQGALWCVAGLGGCTLLATLSKANGALLPLLALLTELVLLGPIRPNPDVPNDAAARSKRHYRLVRSLLLWLPSSLIIGWLLYQGVPDVLAGHTYGRPWTMDQRLLTEPRVIADYLRLLWMPHPYTSGLFNDQFIASRSLFDPLSTTLAVLFVLALLGFAVRWRRRCPALSLAVLFYFGGQLVESTVLPLELYFEHRNYLPALLMFWPVGLWICGAPEGKRNADPVRPVRLPPRLAIAIGLLASLAIMTHARADLWGNTREQALVWARINPNSPRAQANAAQALVATGHPDLAIVPLRQALARSPSEIQLALNLYGAECRVGKVSESTVTATERALRTTADPGVLLAHWFGAAIEGATHPMCPQADFLHIERLLDAARQNGRLVARPGRRQDLAYLQGRIALAQGQAKEALLCFNKAVDQQLRVEAALQQAAELGSAGYPELGLEHLAHFDASRAAARSEQTYRPPFGMPRLHAWVLRRQGYWEQELEHLRATLREDVRNMQATTG